MFAAAKSEQREVTASGPMLAVCAQERSRFGSFGDGRGVSRDKLGLWTSLQGSQAGSNRLGEFIFDHSPLDVSRYSNPLNPNIGLLCQISLSWTKPEYGFASGRFN